MYGQLLSRDFNPQEKQPVTAYDQAFPANRLELLEFLAQGERSVDALAKVSGMSVANTSQHLQQLRQAGLVTTRREGKTVNYRVSDADVLDLVDRLRRVAERHLAEVEQLVNAT